MPTGTTVLGKNVGKDYQIIQNRQTVELAAEIAGLLDGGTLIACGVLDQGVRVFCVIDLPDQTFNTAKHPDRIGSQLIVHTGHDGGTSCSLWLSRTRFFCTNQLTAMLSRSQVSIRHSGDIELSVEEAKAQLGFVLSAEEEFALMAQRLMDEGMEGMSLVRRISDRLRPTVANPSPQQAQARVQRLQRLDQRLETEREQVGSTVTPVMQALTGFNQWYSRTRLDRDLRATSAAFTSRTRQMTRFVLHPELLDA